MPEWSVRCGRYGTSVSSGGSRGLLHVHFGSSEPPETVRESTRKRGSEGGVVPGTGTRAICEIMNVA